jgi:hypothetical protein
MQESFQSAHEEIVLVEPSYLEMFIDKILQAMPFLTLTKEHKDNMH